uniref:Uncharacterized protein n=1 Tax=viral metagenome TaxID=1070528 RepID=A0A6C0EMR2_9ZZZZ
MNKYNNNDLIIKELTEKIILQKKHITSIENDFIRMNENFNYQFEKYKNTINEKLNLHNIIINNFSEDIIYRIHNIDKKNNTNSNSNINNNDDKIIKRINDCDKKILIYKKDYDDKISKCDDYICDINYQLIKLKQDINDKINGLNIDNKINKNNNKNIVINICCGLLLNFLIYNLFY